MEADKYFSKLRREYPDSEYIKDIPKIDSTKLAAAIAAEAARKAENEAADGESTDGDGAADPEADSDSAEESQS